MGRIQRLLLGGADFSESEEYFQFRYRFLYVLLWVGSLSSGIFIVADYFGVNHMAPKHIHSQQIHLMLNLLLAALLYSRKRLFYPVSAAALANSFFVFISALLFVPDDELRILWFFLNLPAVYLLLGQIAGILTTILSIACIVIINRYLSHPYSPNAIATSIVGFAYLSAFFYAYSNKSISYFHRMYESNEKLRFLASHDPLTGIFNARTFYEVCDRMICVALRDKAPFSVMFVDLDHFKNVNDTYGHEAGDVVLKSVAGCLVQSTRICDVSGRIGGEEFCIYLPGTDLDGAKLLGEKLRQAIENLMPAIGDTQHIKVTASIGVAGSLPHHQSIADIQREADQAMYAAKQQGRNRVSCFG